MPLRINLSISPILIREVLQHPTNKVVDLLLLMTCFELVRLAVPCCSMRVRLQSSTYLKNWWLLGVKREETIPYGMKTMWQTVVTFNLVVNTFTGTWYFPPTKMGEEYHDLWCVVLQILPKLHFISTGLSNFSNDCCFIAPSSYEMANWIVSCTVVFDSVQSFCCTSLLAIFTLNTSFTSLSVIPQKLHFGARPFSSFQNCLIVSPFFLLSA